MSQDQLADSGGPRYLCGLLRCAVVVELGAVGAGFVVGTLMIKHGSAFHELMQLGHIARVTTVSIAARWVCRESKARIGDYRAILGRPVCAVLDVGDMTYGDMIEVYHVPTYVRECPFLTKKETATRHTMLKGNGSHREATVFIDNGSRRGINRMELNLVFKSLTVGLHLHLQDGLQLRRSMDMQRCCTPQHAECGYHPDKPEAMVAMQMGNKNVANARETHARTTELYLGALSAVYHEHLVAQLYHLRRCIVAQRGQRTATPEYMYLE